MIEFVMGIDPGAKGAVGLISLDKKHHEVYDTPADIPSMAQLILDIEEEHRIVLCAIEDVHAMPKQGVVSMFNFGRNVGAWLGILSGARIPYLQVRPQEWQKVCLYGKKGETKERSLTQARELYPDLDLKLKKHDGRADAMHLANYAIIQMRGEK